MAHSARSTSGNMLIYILGAIFLMGLLIVLLKGSFQEGTGIDAEKTLITINEVQRYGAELERGVRYIMQNGHSESEIRFARDTTDVGYGLITDRPERQVFSPQGGAVEYRLPPQGVNDGTPWQFYGDTHIPDMGTDGALAHSELIAVLPQVTESFCRALNQNAKQPIDLTQTSIVPCVTVGFFNGDFVDEPPERLLDENEIPNRPVTQACGRCGDGTYHYFRVLLSR